MENSMMRRVFLFVLFVIGSASVVVCAIPEDMKLCMREIGSNPVTASDAAWCNCTKEQISDSKALVKLSCTFGIGATYPITRRILNSATPEVKVLVINGEALPEWPITLEKDDFSDKMYEEIHFKYVLLTPKDALRKVAGTLRLFSFDHCNLGNANLDGLSGPEPPPLQNLGKLEALRFRNMDFPAVSAPGEILVNLSSLRQMDLSGSKSTSGFKLGNFLEPVASGIRELVMLDACLEPVTGVQLSNLTVLQLTKVHDCNVGNRGKWFPDDANAYPSMPSIENLKLANQILNDTEMTAIASYSTLKQLDLSVSIITKIRSSAFSNQTNLRLVDLSDANIAQADHGAFGQFKGELVLSRTRIQGGELFSLLSGAQMSRLKIINSNISALNFAGLTGPVTKALDLSGSSTLVLSASSLEGLSGLESLTITGMPQHAIADALLTPVGSSLKSLDLSNNNIFGLADNFFDKLNVIQEIILANNKLDMLPSSVASRTTLTKLDVSNNNLTTLSESIITGIKAINFTEINFHSNSWICDASLTQIYIWVCPREGKGYQVLCQRTGQCPACATPERVYFDSEYICSQYVPTTTTSSPGSQKPTVSSPASPQTSTTTITTSTSNGDSLLADALWLSFLVVLTLKVNLAD